MTPIPSNYIQFKGQYWHPAEFKRVFKSNPPPIYDRQDTAPAPVGAVQDKKPKRNPVPALDESQSARSKRARRLVIVVTLISYRRRLLDDDNFQNSCKGLRDAIAHSIGLDDGDKRFRWQYAQVRTDGEEGVLVSVEVV